MKLYIRMDILEDRCVLPLYGFQILFIESMKTTIRHAGVDKLISAKNELVKISDDIGSVQRNIPHLQLLKYKSFLECQIQ